MFSQAYVREGLEAEGKTAALKVVEQDYTVEEVPRRLLTLEKLRTMEAPKTWTWIGAMMKAFRVMSMLNFHLQAVQMLIGRMMRVAGVQYLWTFHGNKFGHNRRHYLYFPAEVPGVCSPLAGVFPGLSH